MCRNIRTLFNFEPPATDEEVRASALQFVRKLSGFAHPSRANEAAFARAVDEITEAAGRDGSAGAGDVLDNDRLPERLSHALADHARDHIGRAAGGERHDHGDRPGRKRLRRRAAGKSGYRRNSGHRQNESTHQDGSLP